MPPDLLHTLFAALPILILLGLMVVLRWSGVRAGPAGWLACVLVAAVFFGLTPQVWLISQLKALLLSVYVLGLLWPALLLYNLVHQVGGINAMAHGLEKTITNHGMLLIVLAWAFSAVVEGLAGLGLPIAVVAPMLVGLGVSPLSAVAASAVGHAWAVTFGNAGMVYQTLITIAQVDGMQLLGPAALLLGVCCVACGLACALILKQGRLWPWVIGVGVLMALVQYGLGLAGLGPLSALGAGLVGVLVGVLSGRKKTAGAPPIQRDPALMYGLIGYGTLVVLMLIFAIPGPLRSAAYPIAWQPLFPEVVTRTGLVTPAGPGQALRFIVHPGFSLLTAALISYAVFCLKKICQPSAMRQALSATWSAALPASIGVAAAVGLSTMMDHCGMTLLLAQSLSQALGSFFPIVSPLVGMLGAFATGSNNSSNVLFALLQKNIALLLSLNPLVLLASQTAGGALGSMVAPAKLIIGCSTVNLRGKDGEALRRTLPYGVVIALLVGVLGWLLSR